ncbi:MAG: hypothetical protein JSW50_04250, partial [Candidatus Latescibacterota bacterium]
MTSRGRVIPFCFILFIGAVLTMSYSCGDDDVNSPPPPNTDNCDVEPTWLDFDTIYVGSHFDTTFLIKNTCEDSLFGTVSETCNHYSLVS